jgi:hypothetical protein
MGEGDPQGTSFGSLLRYVLGFMIAMALLAFAAVWLLRHV